MHKKWARLVHTSYKLEARAIASKRIRAIVYEQMHNGPTQNIGDQWRVTTSTLRRGARNNTRVLFHSQIMKLYEKHCYVANINTDLMATACTNGASQGAHGPIAGA